MVPEWKPTGPSRNASAILMPAACFLDPVLYDEVSQHLKTEDPLFNELGRLTEPKALA